MFTTHQHHNILQTTRELKNFEFYNFEWPSKYVHIKDLYNKSDLINYSELSHQEKTVMTLAFKFQERLLSQLMRQKPMDKAYVKKKKVKINK